MDEKRIVDAEVVDEGECPRCHQNSWLANQDDGELTVCENCGFDTDIDD